MLKNTELQLDLIDISLENRIAMHWKAREIQIGQLLSAYPNFHFSSFLFNFLEQFKAQGNSRETNPIGFSLFKSPLPPLDTCVCALLKL